MVAVTRDTDAQRPGFALAQKGSCIVELVLIVLGLQSSAHRIAKMVSAVN